MIGARPRGCASGWSASAAGPRLLKVCAYCSCICARPQGLRLLLSLLHSVLRLLLLHLHSPMRGCADPHCSCTRPYREATQFYKIPHLPTGGLFSVPTLAHWGCGFVPVLAYWAAHVHVDLWSHEEIHTVPALAHTGGFAILYVSAFVHWGTVLCSNTRPLGLCFCSCACPLDCACACISVVA